MGKAKRKAEKAAKEVLGTKAAKSMKAAVDTKKSKSPHKETTRARESNEMEPSTSSWRNREKPLIMCARGITYRYRHLMTDLMQLIPHHKSDSKLDTKHDWNVINEIVELKVFPCSLLCLGTTLHIGVAAGDAQDIFATLECHCDDKCFHQDL